MLLHAGAAPVQLLPLFKGGTFDADFNSDEDRKPIQFPTPENIESAFLEAVITGEA